MLSELFDALTLANLSAFIKDQVVNNQFSQGAIMAGIVGAVIAWGRGVPGALWHFLTRTFTIDVQFNSDSPDYEVASRYVSENMVREFFSRKFVFQTDMKFDDEKWRDVASQRGLTAGYGRHFGLFRGRPVIIHRNLEESQQTKEFKETLTITFIGRSRKPVYRFADEVAEITGITKETFDMVPVRINDGGWWSKMGNLPLRRMSSVFTANNAGQRVVEIIREFEDRKEQDHLLGLPHHLGIMLHGEPGTGKSSLIHAVASETQRSVYYLNLGSVESDKELTSLLSSARTDWSKIILAIEDIDAAGVHVSRFENDSHLPPAITDKADYRKKKAEHEKAKAEGKEMSKVSLSALLNCLDGILCPDGLVVIATTNHLEDLDPALVRPGRFDRTVELGKLGHDDFVRMSNMFGRDPRDFEIDTHKPRTGSEMRSIIMETV